ncbi:hypothetical protein V5O48_009592 [Marasmius crinis-equi]|uniref:F-box domain-containing protein n=1 Tax=Marasmius crinis-equi TaxID=585013 RepID=A0ABR3FAW9_9AGAR
MDELPNETMDRILSFCTQRSRFAALQVNRRLHVVGLRLMCESLNFRSSKDFLARKDFWDDIQKASVGGVVPKEREWKVEGAGGEAILSIPRSLTLGEDESSPIESNFKGRVVERPGMGFPTKTIDIFHLAAKFVNLRKITIWKTSFPVSSLLDLLTDTPCVESIVLYVLPNSGSSNASQTALIDESQLPRRLASLSLLGLDSKSLHERDWETLHLLASLDSVGSLEYDVSSWCIFFDVWHDKVSDQKEMVLDCYRWRGSEGSPIRLTRSKIISCFSIISHHNGERLPLPDRYRESSVASYLGLCTASLTTLRLPVVKEVSNNVGPTEWPDFPRLVTFRGPTRIFQELDQGNNRWSNISFDDGQGFAAFDTRPFMHLRTLRLSLSRDVDFPFVLSSGGPLREVYVKFVGSDWRNWCDKDSLTCVQLCYSKLEVLELTFEESPRLCSHIAQFMFSCWKRILPRSLLSVRVLGYGSQGDTEISWIRGGEACHWELILVK